MPVYISTVNGCRVDEEDFSYLQKFKWYTSKKGYSFIYRHKYGKTSYRVYMHWMVVNRHGIRVPRYSEVDHIDRNKQNNCFKNLRVVTRMINLANKTKILVTEEEKERDRITIKMRQDGWTEEAIEEYFK